ncbi:MAG TPA: tripartite tricarboxylate transporter permease [Xanthobacteraceae bacterium]
MELIDHLLLGWREASSWQNLFYCFLGVTLGNLLGVLPGVGSVAAVSILLPVTYHVPPATGLIMLAGLYYGAVYGAVTGAILLNIPHTVSAIECLDGYPMAQKGRAGIALFMTTMASLAGSSVGIVVLALFAPPLAAVALTFQSPEYFALVVLGMTGAAVLTHGSPLKSFISVILGMLIGLVGIDVTSGAARFTFGLTSLLDGIGIGVIAMGLFGISEIIINAGTIAPPVLRPSSITWRSLLPSREEFAASWRSIIRGAGIGAGLGLLPGAGPVLASIMGYALEKQIAQEPGRFGHGAIEGVVGPEAAANAACQTGFVPTLTLGIPADPIMAVMLSALTVKGISTGPEFITAHPDLFWGLLVSFIIGNVLLVIWHVPFIGLWVRLLTIPFQLLFPAVLVFMCIGVYSIRQSSSDVLTMLFFGGVGYAMRLLKFSPAPLLIGLVLGPAMEQHLRRSLIVSRGDPMIFIQRPISAAILAAAAVILTWTIYKSVALAQAQKNERESNNIPGETRTSHLQGKQGVSPDGKSFNHS